MADEKLDDFLGVKPTPRWRRWIKWLLVAAGFALMGCLLLAAAYAQLRRGERVTLSASNPKALRALERAVCGVRRTMELDTLGEPTRDVYLMQEKKGWREASRERATAELKRISLDAITVMKVTVHDPALSWQDAAALDARHAPETVYVTDEVAPVSEPRERTSAHPNMFEEDASRYNDAGELETPAERREPVATRLGFVAIEPEADQDQQWEGDRRQQGGHHRPDGPADQEHQDRHGKRTQAEHDHRHPAKRRAALAKQLRRHLRG